MQDVKAVPELERPGIGFFPATRDQDYEENGKR